MTPALETLILALESLALPPSRALFLGAQAHPQLSAWGDLLGWQPWRPTADAWDAAGFARCDDIDEEKKWPLILLLPGKSRDETLAWFGIAERQLEPGGRLIVAMPNSAGAGRFEQELSKATHGIASLQKHKCRAFHATHDGSWDRDRFAAWRKLGDVRPLAEFPMVTQAGIFSCDHVDPGSEWLATQLPSSLAGRAADLGSGWGFLSAALMARCPRITQLDGYEADFRAIACARLNLANESRNVNWHWHDVTRGVPSGYDVMVTNPPFHTGQKHDVDLGRAFLTAAIAGLRRGGHLWLVANRQLPYETVLSAERMAWRECGSHPVYKILTGQKR